MKNSDIIALQERYILKSQELSTYIEMDASYEQLKSLFSELQSIYDELEILNQRRFIQLRLDISWLIMQDKKFLKYFSH